MAYCIPEMKVGVEEELLGLVLTAWEVEPVAMVVTCLLGVVEGLSAMLTEMTEVVEALILVVTMAC